MMMTYRRPFDKAQWHQAKLVYKGLRSNLRMLRRDFPAHTIEESNILIEYAAIIRQFGEELLKPLRKIDVSKLNKLDGDSIRAYIAYSDVYNDVD